MPGPVAMILAPGQYLKRRRIAAGLSTRDVAARVATEPRVAEHERLAMIEAIEADAAPAVFRTLVALRVIYPFSFDILGQLTWIAMGESLPAPRLCRACACSEFDPCTDVDGYPCGWVSLDLCTACKEAAAPAA